MFQIVDAQAAGRLGDWLATRRGVYRASGLLNADVPDPYVDRYDDYSVHLLAVDMDTASIVGTSRLILRDGDARPLQVEAQFGVIPEARSVEISGFAIQEAYRDGLASLGLIRGLIESAREHDAEMIYAEVEPWFLASLQTVGFPLTQITEPQWFYNAWNLVAVASVDGFFQGVAEAWRRGGHDLVTAYFSHPYDGTVHTRHLTPAQRTSESRELA